MIHSKKATQPTITCSLFVVTLACIFATTATAQPLHGPKDFTRQDTLRGTLRPERTWWNVLKYDIAVTPDYERKTIEGVTIITFKVVKPGKRMQIDLQQPMQSGSMEWNNIPLQFTRDGNVYWVDFPQPPPIGSIQTITLTFNGQPKEAKRAPWDGGWIWSKDQQGRPWMTVACQGLGASVWYPCKDHQSDEPDSGAVLSITVPDTLVAVGNGRLQKKETHTNGTATYTWRIVNPINNYTIVPYIGKYVTWHEDFQGEKGKLDCDYWVLDYNLEKGKTQFKQADTMLKCFEHWFGPYPFYEDSYKLVEAPHLGMEHQSAVAYGNGFRNGYSGRDLSGTGWGSKWDFIIIHESGHEWFANSITTNDLADMWIHEGFANYSETLYTTCLYGVEAGNAYCTGTRKLVRNDIPIIGPYQVNQEGSGDMYYKGGNMLHTIRQLVNNDEKFRQLLRGLNKTYYHKTVDTRDVENYMSRMAGQNFSKVFDQYLRTIKIPVLEYKISGKQLQYRWTNCVKGFNMPVKVKWGKDTQWLKPVETWRTLNGKEKNDTLTVDRNFYVTAQPAS